MDEWKYDVWVAEWEAMYGGTSNTAAAPARFSGSMGAVSLSTEPDKEVEMDSGTKVASAHKTMREVASQHPITGSNTEIDAFHIPTPPPSTVDNSSKTSQDVPEHTK